MSTTTDTPWRSQARTTDETVRDLITELLSAYPPPPGDWTGDALCPQVGGDLWFPEKAVKGFTIREARFVCDACPVQAECADYALDNRIREGMWGGLTPNDRRRIWAQQDHEGQA